jgi:hypothetical protein
VKCRTLLAHHFQELLDTHAVETEAELVELAKLTPPFMGLQGGS